MTLFEVLVASAMMVSVVGLTLSAMLSTRNGFLDNIERVRLEQNLRGGFDFMSINIRQAGENLPGSFPAVEVIDGGEALPDTLILRRNLVQEVHTLCEAATAGTQTLYISNTLLDESACIYANVTTARNIWETEREDNDGSVRIYIWDRSARVGEFLDYTNEGEITGRYHLTTSSTSRDYPYATTSIYMLEEFRFEVDIDENALILEQDGDSINPENVVFNVENFRIDITMQDDTTLTELDASGTNSWKDIRSINLTLGGSEELHDSIINTEISGSYFPRNVLSTEE